MVWGGGINIGKIGWGLQIVDRLILGLFGALEHTSEVREWEGLTLLTGWKTGMLTYVFLYGQIPNEG